MLFSYQPLFNAKIENLDKFNRYFFMNLFIYEPKTFNEQLLIHSNFKRIFDAHTSTVKEQLKTIHKAYISLNKWEREIVKEAFQNNRHINEICNGSLDPIKYNQLHRNIRKELEKYLTKLWTLLTEIDGEKNQKIKEQCGNIYDHYCNLFKDKKQVFTVCPVCGLEELLGEYDACENANIENYRKVREAYDHYLPKSLYPFTSILFSNLLPICHHCNSDYKGEYDTPFNGVDRQKCFYPYSTNIDNKISVRIEYNSVLEDLTDSDDWTLSFNSPFGKEDEIKSWDLIFDISLRYKNRIKAKQGMWKDILYEAYRSDKKLGIFDLDIFKSRIYNTIKIEDQSSAIVQKAYYDYYLANILPEVIEMERDMDL